MTALLPIRADCASCPARKFAPCGAIKQTRGVDFLRRNSLHRSFKAGTVIYFQGDCPSHLMTIVSGVVASTARLGDGRTQILSLHFRGDVLGQINDRPMHHEMIALTEVRLCYISQADFSQALGIDEDFRNTFIQNTLATLDQSRSWMLALGRKTALERVSTLLAFLAMRGKDAASTLSGKAMSLELPLSRAEIGTFLGLDIATVSRMFSKLKGQGIIEVNKRDIIICDLALLLSEAGDDDGGMSA